MSIHAKDRFPITEGSIGSINANVMQRKVRPTSRSVAAHEHLTMPASLHTHILNGMLETPHWRDLAWHMDDHTQHARYLPLVAPEPSASVHWADVRRIAGHEGGAVRPAEARNHRDTVERERADAG